MERGQTSGMPGANERPQDLEDLLGMREDGSFISLDTELGKMWTNGEISRELLERIGLARAVLEITLKEGQSAGKVSALRQQLEKLDRIAHSPEASTWTNDSPH